MTFEAVLLTVGSLVALFGWLAFWAWWDWYWEHDDPRWAWMYQPHRPRKRREP